MGFLRIIGGLILAAFGMAMTVKSSWIYENFGSVAWAEEHLGMDGGSRLFYKLLGVLTAFAGILMATGLLQSLLIGTVGQLFVPGARPR